MSINLNKLEGSNQIYLAPLVLTGTGEEGQDTPLSVTTEHLPLTPQIQGQDGLSPEPKTALLEEKQKNTLTSILSQSYPIPGKNRAPNLELNLLSFLKELQQQLQLHLQPGESISIALIGSTVGHIINPEQTGYNDLDFLIHVQVPMKADLLTNQSTFTENLAKTSVREHCTKTTKDIAVCLATQLKLPKKDVKTLNNIENNYFNEKPSYFNESINQEGSRCSIIKLGILEFKTVIDFYSDDGAKTVIPGLKNSSAFNSDDMHIDLMPFLADKGMPLAFCSHHVPIKQAMKELKRKQLCTSSTDPSKCPKAIDNITFKNCYFPEEKTNKEIYAAFLGDTKSRQKLINHLRKYEAPDAVICALSNFYINSANLGVDPFYGILAEVLPKFKELPEKLLLKWFQLTLFLSARPAGRNLQLTLDGQTYYLLKPKHPLGLLQDFMQQLEENPKISLEELPQYGLEFKTVLQLFLSMEPRLENEQLLSFNSCLIFHFPPESDGKGDQELKTLLCLLTSLSKSESAEDRQKLIQQTELSFKSTMSGLFDRLKKCNSTSQLFLTYIQALAPSHRNTALELWSYANQEQLFSPVDELEASICFEEGSPQNKKELISLLERMMFGLSCVSTKLTAQPDSFNQLLLSCVGKLGQEDLNLKNLKCILDLLKGIAPLSPDVKEKIINKFLGILTTFQNNPVSSESYDAALQILKTILETQTDTKLQGQALKLYSSFVQSCLNGQELALGHIAEKILRSGIKSSYPDCGACHAELFSNLICTHAKTDHGEALLAEAVEKEILNKVSPTALIKMYSTVPKGLSSPKLVEPALQNPSLVQALLNSRTKDANDLILLLINNSHPVESAAAIQNLVALFEKISLFALKEKRNLKPAMLGMLLKLLPNLKSVPVRRALVGHTQQFFEKNPSQLFESLNASSNLNLSTSQLSLMCIQELIPLSPELALSLWQQADETLIFADSAVAELEAFACIKKVKLNGNPAKEELIHILQEAMVRLRCLSKQLSAKDGEQLDSFNAYLLTLAVKLGREEFTSKDLKLIQEILGDIGSLKCISPSITAEFADIFLDALTLLTPKLLQKKAQQDLLAILKSMPQKAAPRVVRCLKACPKGYTLADGFLKTPLFVSTLIEEMKQGGLEDNIEWFTLLNQKKIMKSNDQKSLECCIALLAQWAQNPSAKRCSQVLSALQLLKNFIETKSKKGVDKNQAIKGYIDFIQGCITGGEPQLLQEAEKALKAGFISAGDKANLFSSLICAHPKEKPAVDLFNEALKQNILNENTPVALVTAYLVILEGLAVSNPKKTSQFAETALQCPTLIKFLLESQGENKNALILTLLHCFRVEQTNQLNNRCQPKPHATAIANLILLFAQLYKNRHSSQDDTIDESIRFQTTHLFQILDKIDSISFRQWGALINALASGKALFEGHEEMAREGFDPVLRKIINWMIQRSPQSLSDEKRKKENSEKLLAICEKCEGLPCLPQTASDLQLQHLKMLTLLDRTEDLLEKLNHIQETWLYFRAIEQILIIFLTLEKSKQTNNTTETIEQILTLLENYREPNPLAKGLKFSDFYCIFALLDTATLKDEPFVSKAFEILEELLKSHLEKFENAAQTCTDIIDAACKLDYLPYASSILDYAIKEKILVGKECIEALEFKIQAQAVEMIGLYIVCLQEVLKSEGSIQIDAFLNNSSLIDSLLLTSKTKEANELMLLLVDNCHLATSEKAIKNLLNLFKQLCAPAKIAHLSSELVNAMMGVLETNTMIPETQAQEAKELIYISVKELLLSMHNYISSDYKHHREFCLGLLAFFERHEKFPFDLKDSLGFQMSHIQSLILLDCPDKLLLKLQNIPDPFSRFQSILHAFYFILETNPEEFFASDKTVTLFEMLEGCCENSLEKIPNLDLMTTFILALLEASTENNCRIVLSCLETMENHLKLYPEKFSDLKDTYTDLLSEAIAKDYFEFADSLLEIAEKQGVAIEAELISKVKMAEEAISKEYFEFADSLLEIARNRGIDIEEDLISEVKMALEKK